MVVVASALAYVVRALRVVVVVGMEIARGRALLLRRLRVMPMLMTMRMAAMSMCPLMQRRLARATEVLARPARHVIVVVAVPDQVDEGPHDHPVDEDEQPEDRRDAAANDPRAGDTASMSGARTSSHLPRDHTIRGRRADRDSRLPGASGASSARIRGPISRVARVLC